MLHISDIKKYERCPRLFWLSRKYHKEFIPFVNYNENMQDLVMERLMIRDAFIGKTGDDPSLAMTAWNEGKNLINARFAYEDMRIKIPVMIQEDEKCVVYFTYQNCYPKESEAQYIADHLTILKIIGISVDEVYVIHLNASYIRMKELDIKELLVINDRLFNTKNHAHHLLKDLIEEKMRDVTVIMEELRQTEMREDVPVERCISCTRGNKCIYYDDCFPDKPEPSSIQNLVQSAYKYDMLEEGIVSLKDVDISRIEGTRHQYAQIMADKNGGFYMDSAALKCWIDDHIQYPISYLDFEWETYAYPPYEGMKPFDVLTFQYSLHVEEKDKPDIRHSGYIGEKDCRMEFMEHLLKDLPETGTILVYNMEGAEKLRLVQLAKQFPQYEDRLRKVWERMVDLSLPFSTGSIYDTRMAGLYSLKTLVPLFSTYSYADLEISYGMDAVEKYRQYESMEEGEEKTQIYHQLMEYCSLDTYAEYIVYHAILGLLSKNEKSV